MSRISDVILNKLNPFGVPKRHTGDKDRSHPSAIATLASRFIAYSPLRGENPSIVPGQSARRALAIKLATGEFTLKEAAEKLGAMALTSGTTLPRHVVNTIREDLDVAGKHLSNLRIRQGTYAEMLRHRVIIATETVAIGSHPIIYKIGRLMDESRFDDAYRFIVQQAKQDVPSYLKQPLMIALGYINEKVSQPYSMNFLASNLAEVRDTQVPSTRRTGNSFQNTLYRGDIKDYEAYLFGAQEDHPLGSTSVQHTSLGRMIALLPPNAIVADWGGGLGIFGHEVKSLRPDAEVYVSEYGLLDRNWESLAQTQAPRWFQQASLEHVKNSIHYLSEQPYLSELPGRKKADLIIATTVGPFIEDPIAFLVHGYNQLKPGGVFVLKMNSEIFNSNLKWHQSKRVLDEIESDFFQLGIDIERYGPDGTTFAIRKKGAENLAVNASKPNAYVDYSNHTTSQNHATVTVFYKPSLAKGINQWIDWEDTKIESKRPQQLSLHPIMGGLENPTQPDKTDSKKTPTLSPEQKVTLAYIESMAYDFFDIRASAYLRRLVQNNEMAALVEVLSFNLETTVLQAHEMGFSSAFMTEMQRDPRLACLTAFAIKHGTREDLITLESVVDPSSKKSTHPLWVPPGQTGLRNALWRIFKP